MDFLNHDNILRSTDDVERHPLKPFLPQGCKVLFLGSFPPQRKRWCVDFFYPNFTNDHWRIEGLVFFDDKNYFVDTARRTFLLDRIVAFLRERGIGFYDTATAVRRLQQNASDKFLEIVEPTDIEGLLAEVPACSTLAVTGEKATLTLCRNFGVEKMPPVGGYVSVTLPLLGHSVHIYRLPSSSRAYPLSIEKKAEAYKRMFGFCGLI